MKNLVIFLSILAVTAFGQTVTVIGNIRNVKLNRYPIEIRQFNVSRGDKLAAPDEQKICEALDKSQLVLIGVGMTGWDTLFSSQAISNSFTEALRRGCTIYIGPQDYDTMGSVGVRTHQFFRKIGTYPWTRANYKKLPKGSNGKAQAIAGVPWMKEGIIVDAAIHFGPIDGRPWKPLFKDKNGCIMGVFQESILEKGTLVICAGLDVYRSPNHPVIDALIHKAFGDLKPVEPAK